MSGTLGRDGAPSTDVQSRPRRPGPNPVLLEGGLARRRLPGSLPRGRSRADADADADADALLPEGDQSGSSARALVGKGGTRPSARASVHPSVRPPGILRLEEEPAPVSDAEAFSLLRPQDPRAPGLWTWHQLWGFAWHERAASLPPSLPRAHGVEPAATGRPGRSPGVLQALRLHLRGSFLFSASGCLVSLNFGFSAYRPECPFCFVSGLLVCLCDTTSLLCFLFLFFEVLSPCYFYLHLSDGQ